MSDSLNVVGLISGGKDSLYSLLHCIRNGHKIVALANLHPRVLKPRQDEDHSTSEIEEDNSDNEDINSFMYQTVGHSIVPLYAEALELPLYRGEITGSAVQTSRDYAFVASKTFQSPLEAGSKSVEQDETEDLFSLLQKVLNNHPEVNAISTGAIQSTYQRTRIESIAVRLGLTPLAFLWQYPVLPQPMNARTGQPEREDSTTSLLDDMAAAGCESRIIKIASGGIRESLLWSDVTNSKTRTQLIAGLRRFFDNDELGLRGAVVGEGGEFETLALNGPRILWKGGNIVTDGDIKTTSGEGGASYVKIRAAKVIAHESDIGSSAFAGDEAIQVRVPALLDPQFQVVQKALHEQETAEHDKTIEPMPSADARDGPVFSQIPRLQHTVSSNSAHIANLTYLGRHRSGPDREPPDTRTQMQLIAGSVPELLSEISADNRIDPPLTSSDIVSTLLLLKDMSNFAIINPIYATIFSAGVPIPPARVTVAAALPQGIEVMLSIVLDLGPRLRRRGLHIQGRSYWAPANIGPYSQAVAVPLRLNSADEEVSELCEIVHVAGQIPLVPASMILLNASFVEQAILSIQHLWRVGQERQVDQWLTGIVFLPKAQKVDVADQRAVTTSNIWRSAYLVPALARLKNQRIEDQDEEEDIDVWHIQNNHASVAQAAQTGLAGEHLRSLPSHKMNLLTDRVGLFIPAFIAAEVTGLPRDASVEWWSTGLTRLESMRQGQVTWKVLPGLQKLALLASHTEDAGTNFLTCLLPKSLGMGQRPNSEHLTSMIDSIFDETSTTHPRTITGTAFVAMDALEAWSSLATRATGMQSCFDGLSVIPCYRLWGHEGGRINLELGEHENTSTELMQLDVALILQVDIRDTKYQTPYTMLLST